MARLDTIDDLLSDMIILAGEEYLCQFLRKFQHAMFFSITYPTSTS